MQQNYLTNHNGDELCYGKKISYLFRNAITSIEKKLQSRFPINTLDVINTQDKVAMVLYDYADTFMINDGTCNIKEKSNTSLNNETNPYVMDLEDMNEDWRKVTLLSFGSKRKVAMNGFISWHLWTKTIIDNTCVKKYIKIQKIHKTDFYNDSWDDFCKLNIETFFKLDTSQTFTINLIRKNDILDLRKCIVNTRVIKSKKESIKHQQSVAKIHIVLVIKSSEILIFGIEYVNILHRRIFIKKLPINMKFIKYFNLTINHQL